MSRGVNSGGNTGRILNVSQEEADAAVLKLSPRMKEFLVEYDIGSYSPVQILELIAQVGEEKAMWFIRVDRNMKTYAKYGPEHPNFDPSLPYRRP